MLHVHHATATKASKLGVHLTAEGDRFVAIDTIFAPDNELTGPKAPELLEFVLKRRPEGKQEVEPDAALVSPPSSELCDEAVSEAVSEPDGEVVSKTASEPQVQNVSEVESEEEDEHEQPHGSVIQKWRRDQYTLTNDSCGDAIADALKLATSDDKGKMVFDDLVQVGRDNGVDVMARWGERNPGMIRMNLGNVLRAMIRNGNEVVIGSATFKPEVDSEGKVVGMRSNKSRGARR